MAHNFLCRSTRLDHTKWKADMAGAMEDKLFYYKYMHITYIHIHGWEVSISTKIKQ